MESVVRVSKFLRRLRPEPRYAGATAAAATPPRKPTKTPRASDIPRAFLLQDLTEKREFRRLARHLSAFLAFLVIYASLLIMDRDVTGKANLRQALSRELLERSRAPSGIKFMDIDSTHEFWDWLTNSFFVSVYASTDADGRPRSDDEMYTVASRSKIIGGFRILQQRSAVIDTSAFADARSNPCLSRFVPAQDQLCVSHETDATAPFGSTNGSAASAAELEALEMFQYSINDDIGGYQTLFLRSATDGSAELAKLDQMRAHGWIDRLTKSVEIELPLYNFDMRYCAVVQLRVKFTSAGRVVPAAFFFVTNIEPYNLLIQVNLVRVVYEAVYVVLLAYFHMLELWSVCVVFRGNVRKYMRYYGTLETLGEWCILSTNIIIVWMRYGMMTMPRRDEFLQLESLSEFLSMLMLAQVDDFFLAVNILNVLLLTVRAIKYFQVTDGGRRLTSSVFNAMPDVVSFLPIYGTVVLGYTVAGYMLYGFEFPEWSTMTGAFFRVFEINFGLYDPSAIYDASGTIGLFYICSASIVFCIIMLNVFLAIIMATWDHMTEREREKTRERQQFREKMSTSEVVGLIFMRAATLDALIAAVNALEDHDTITKHVFEQAWRAQQPHVSKLMREHILKWYWLPGDPCHAAPTRVASSSPLPAAARSSPALESGANASVVEKTSSDNVTRYQRPATTRVVPIATSSRAHESETQDIPTH